MHIKLIPKEKEKSIIAALQFSSREDIQRGWTFPAILSYVQVPVGLSLTQMTIFSWPFFKIRMLSEYSNHLANSNLFEMENETSLQSIFQK